MIVDAKDKIEEPQANNRSSELTKYDSSAAGRSSLGPDGPFAPSANDALYADDYGEEELDLNVKDVQTLINEKKMEDEEGEVNVDKFIRQLDELNYMLNFVQV